jgi:uncharacterized damage-inducible protein DinB
MRNVSKMIDTILAELEQEAKTTARVLDRVPGDKLAWKPHDKSKSLGDLAWHLASVPGRIATMAAQGDEADAAAIKAPSKPETAEGIRKAFDESVAEVRKRLSGLSDAELSRPFAMKYGGKVIIQTPTRLAFLRSVLLNHSYHHRGQLTVYLRLLDVPVPSVYGPTADEPL